MAGFRDLIRNEARQTLILQKDLLSQGYVPTDPRLAADMYAGNPLPHEIVQTLVASLRTAGRSVVPGNFRFSAIHAEAIAQSRVVEQQKKLMSAGVFPEDPKLVRQMVAGHPLPPMELEELLARHEVLQEQAQSHAAYAQQALVQNLGRNSGNSLNGVAVDQDMEGEETLSNLPNEVLRIENATDGLITHFVQNNLSQNDISPRAFEATAARAISHEVGLITVQYQEARKKVGDYVALGVLGTLFASAGGIDLAINGIGAQAVSQATGIHWAVWPLSTIATLCGLVSSQATGNHKKFSLGVGMLAISFMAWAGIADRPKLQDIGTRIAESAFPSIQRAVTNTEREAKEAAALYARLLESAQVLSGKLETAEEELRQDQRLNPVIGAVRVSGGSVNVTDERSAQVARDVARSNAGSATNQHKAQQEASMQAWHERIASDKETIKGIQEQMQSVGDLAGAQQQAAGTAVKAEGARQDARADGVITMTSILSITGILALVCFDVLGGALTKRIRNISKRRRLNNQIEHSQDSLLTDDGLKARATVVLTRIDSRWQEAGKPSVFNEGTSLDSSAQQVVASVKHMLSSSHGSSRPGVAQSRDGTAAPNV